MVEPWDDRLPVRFWEKVQPHPVTDCWLWTGHLLPNGYGRFVAVLGSGRKVYPHRLAYEALVGPIPEGHQIDHVRARGCAYRHCVNPAHLEPVTQRVNISRGMKATATHCKHGHEFTPQNTRIRANGTRACKRCAADRALAAYHARKTA